MWFSPIFRGLCPCRAAPFWRQSSAMTEHRKRVIVFGSLVALVVAMVFVMYVT